MADILSSQAQPEGFSVSVPPVFSPPPVGRIEKEQAAYAALMSGYDPIEAFDTITREMQYTGKSRELDSIINRVSSDYDLSRRETMRAILEDEKLPVQNKREALYHYQQTMEVPPSLKDEYEVKVASAYNTAEIDPKLIANAFIEKQQSAEKLQREIDDVGMNFDASYGDAVLGLGLYVIPFFGTWYSGKQLADMQAAVDGKDYGFADQVLKGIFQGDAEKQLRASLSKLPPGPQRDEAKRAILAVIKSSYGADFNKYIALKSSIEGEQEEWERWLADGLGLLGAVFGARVIGKAFSKTTKTGVKLTVDPKSVLGTTAAHNPTVAATMATKAIVDETGRIADSLGTTRAKIVADILAAPDTVYTHGLKTEAAESIRRNLQNFDSIISERLSANIKNIMLYKDEFKDGVLGSIKDAISKSTSAALHLGKSSIKDVSELGAKTDFGVEVNAVFGKTSDGFFSTFDEALERAKALSGELPEGVLTIKRLDSSGQLAIANKSDGAGEFYINYKVNRDLNPNDLLLFGPDALKIRFDLFGKTIESVSEGLTKLAKYGNVGAYLFAHHLMPHTAAQAAFKSADAALAIEEPLLQLARDNIVRQSGKVKKTASLILKEGEDFKENGNIGTLFTYEEVIKKALARGHSRKEAENVALSYFSYRQLADHIHHIKDYMKSAEFRNSGYKWFSTTHGEKHIAKAVTLNEVEDVRKVFNMDTGALEAITKKQLDMLYKNNDFLVRLGNKYHIGDEVVEYAVAGKNFLQGEVLSGAVPYIKGYVPRLYDNYYFVTRYPKQVMVNGVMKSTKDMSSTELNKYATTVKAAGSKKEADELAKELKDDNAWFDVKTDRRTTKSAFMEHDVARQTAIHSMRRGEKPLEGGDLKDPLEAMMNLIPALSKKVAFDEFLTVSKGNFIKHYGDFLAEPGKFPSTVDDIVLRPNMSESQMERFRDARAIFNWLEGMVIMQRYDSAFYRDMMYGAGEFADKFAGFLGNAFRGLAQHYPADYLRKLATALFISLRPLRQILLQPMQLLTYAAADPGLLRPSNMVKHAREMSALYMLSAYKNSSKIAKTIPDDVNIAIGAKIMGMSEASYRQLADHLKNTGFIQSVDSNTLIDGYYATASKKLDPTMLERAGEVTKGVASFAPTIGRAVGFDIGERVNLIGSFLIARRRLQKMSPTIDINSREAIAQPVSDAREIAFSMTRPGAFQYQKNALALPFQFFAAPHKAILNITTSKFWTPAEKARLMASHFLLYGSAGLGLSKWLMTPDGLDIRGRFGDVVEPEVLRSLEDGIVFGWGVNKTLSYFMNEDVDLDLTGSFSPVSNGVLPFSEFLHALREKDFYQVILGPSFNATSRVTNMLRDWSSIMNAEYSTELKIENVARSVAYLTSMGTDKMKYDHAMNLGMIVTSGGYPVHINKSVTQARAQLFGIQTKLATVAMDEIRRSKSTTEDVREEANLYFKDFVRSVEMYGDDENKLREFNKNVHSVLSVMPEGPKKKMLMDEFNSLLRKYETSTGRSLAVEMYNSAYYKSKEDLTRTFNRLNSYGHEELSAAADTIKLLIGEE